MLGLGLGSFRLFGTFVFEVFVVVWLFGAGAGCLGLV